MELSTAWEGARGIGGIFERLFAQRVMRGIYAEELDASTPMRASAADDPHHHPDPTYWRLIGSLRIFTG